MSAVVEVSNLTRSCDSDRTSRLRSAAREFKKFRSTAASSTNFKIALFSDYFSKFSCFMMHVKAVQLQLRIKTELTYRINSRF